MKTVTVDPVCGMKVDESSPFYSEKNEVIYYFCSEKCRAKFERDPKEFIEQGGRTNAEREPPGDEKRRQEGRGSSWKDYVPLMVIVVLALLAASAKQQADADPWSWASWMHDFMGVFLVMFSMFKFFDPEGFADGFQMYDLLAKPFRPYAYVYPFIELGLGLGYLAHWQPRFIYSATVVVMLFGSLGVLNALRKGLDLECACMGTVLRVPLSTVALVEDLGMAAMAGAMLIA